MDMHKSLLIKGKQEGLDETFRVGLNSKVCNQTGKCDQKHGGLFFQGNKIAPSPPRNLATFIFGQQPQPEKI